MVNDKSTKEASRFFLYLADRITTACSCRLIISAPLAFNSAALPTTAYAAAHWPSPEGGKLNLQTVFNCTQGDGRSRK